jgi:hypothetical protein
MANKLKKKSAGSEGGNKERRKKRQTRGGSGLGDNRGKIGGKRAKLSVNDSWGDLGG